MYPGTESYRATIIPSRRIDECRWIPVCCGILWQNGSAGMILGISSLDVDVVNSDNTEQLVALVKYVDQLKSDFGIKHISYSGILPGVLASRRLRRASTELPVTVTAIEVAIRELATHEFGNNSEVAVIVLGGRGFVGRRLIKILGSHLVYCIDRDGGESWPLHLIGKPAILVNVASADAISDYLDVMWPQIAVLNEAYPDPSLELANRIKAIGCRLYHLSGLVGGAFPPFPYAYASSIPCCAGIEQDNAGVLIKQL